MEERVRHSSLYYSLFLHSPSTLTVQTRGRAQWKSKMEKNVRKNEGPFHFSSTPLIAQLVNTSRRLQVNQPLLFRSKYYAKRT